MFYLMNREQRVGGKKDSSCGQGHRGGLEESHK